MKYDFNEGEILLIDKEVGWSSFQVVSKIRNLFKIKKIGHGGTLDPLASGLLVLATGKKTKSLQQITAYDKSYTGTFVLGATTPSYDLETKIDNNYPTSHITNELIDKTVEKFLGEQLQTPPNFSAVKINGKRAYISARKGEEIKIEPRKINISNFKIIEKRDNEVDFEVHVSKGTYIRSLAFDFGKSLNSGAYLSALRRVTIGEFDINQSLTIQDLINYKKSLESN